MGDKQVTRIRTAKALIQKSATTAAKQPLPTRVPVHPLLQLQRQIGNQAVTRLIQAKLTIGEPGDKYEQEADRVAAQVVSQINAPTPQPSSQGQTVQRQEMAEDEKLQTKPEISSIQRQEMPQEEELQTKPEVGAIQRQEMPQEEELQTKPMVQRQPGGDGMAATPQLEASIQQARGGGQPLSDSIRKPMEQAFGADFSGVRVHTDAQSDELNQSIQAKAFTTGQDIFFRQGEYDPENRKELLAHELTHVVQQSGVAARSSQQPRVQHLQRAVAFEAESYDTWKISGKKPNEEKYKSIKETKDDLGTYMKLAIKSDDGHLEFTTQPIQNERELNQTFKSMRYFLDLYAKKSPYVINELPKEMDWVQWRSVANYDSYQLRTDKPQGNSNSEKALFLPQATIDIPFEKVTEFLNQYNKNQGNEQLIGNQFSETAEYIRSTDPEGFINNEKLKPLKYPASKGFLKMVLMALYDALVFSGGEDPKYAFPVMPRNRYSEMYERANIKSNQELENVFPSFMEGVVQYRNQFSLSQRLFQKGYKGDQGKVDGPTVEDWFNSILTPPIMEGEFGPNKENERRADLLSPPPGQRTKREGLGAYNLADGDIPFFELRDFMSAQHERKPYTLPEITRAARALLALEQAMNG